MVSESFVNGVLTDMMVNEGYSGEPNAYTIIWLISTSYTFSSVQKIQIKTLKGDLFQIEVEGDDQV